MEQKKGEERKGRIEICDLRLKTAESAEARMVRSAEFPPSLPELRRTGIPHVVGAVPEHTSFELLHLLHRCQGAFRICEMTQGGASLTLG